MADKNNHKDLINYVLVIGLFILAGIVLYPIIYSIIYGILIAYMLYPVHKFILKRVKNEFLSALFVCIGLLIILVVIAVLLFGAVFNQVVDFYLYFQKLDLVGIIRKILPDFISSSGVSENIISSINNQVSNILGNYLKGFTQTIASFPRLILRIAVVIFTFFFALKDGKKAIEYFRSFSTLKKETEEKFIKHFKDITTSVLMGQVLVGIIQGIVAGIGYFIFGVPNAILLTFLTSITSMIPLFGAWLVWLPIDIFLFANGNTGPAIGLLIYGAFVISLTDNVIRTWIVSKRAQIHTGIVLIGMLGGLLVFGFLGLLIGPLILAYVLLVIEVYRKNALGEDKDIIFKKPE